MKAKSFILVLFAFFLSCRKDNNSNIVLDGALTNCPAGNTCTYKYYDNADISSEGGIVKGNYKVFNYLSIDGNSCGPNVVFHLKPLYLVITSLLIRHK